MHLMNCAGQALEVGGRPLGSEAPGRTESTRHGDGRLASAGIPAPPSAGRPMGEGRQKPGQEQEQADRCQAGGAAREGASQSNQTPDLRQG